MPPAIEDGGTMAYGDGERESQPRGLVGKGGRRACDDGNVADADNAGLQIAGREPGISPFPACNGAQYCGSDVADRQGVGRGTWRQPRGDEQENAKPGGDGKIMGYADGGRQGHDIGCERTKPREVRNIADAGTHDSSEWRPEPRLGGNLIRPTRRLDFPGWPAGRGAEQFSWEPPRTIPGGSVKGRAARLKMLGNMVMPDQAAVLFREIVEADETMGGWEDEPSRDT